MTAHERYPPGTRVGGRVVRFATSGAEIEIEPGVEGFLHQAEMSWSSHPRHASEVLAEGDWIETVVLRLNSRERRLRLGLRQLADDPWATAHERYAPGTRVRGKVLSLTDERAFVAMEPGIEGLLHRSDVNWGRSRSPAEVCQIGDSVETVVLRLDPGNRHLTLGIKQLTEDPWTSAGERYPAGTKVTGTVVNLTVYGAFIEVEPGIDGLLHQSEMSWRTRRSDPSEILSKGVSLEVVVLGCDPENRRLELGLKQLTEDPWTTAPERYPAGSRVRGRVVRLVHHGAFIEIEPGFVGLVRLADLSWKRVRQPSDVVGTGDSVEIVVLHIDKDKRHLTLGLKQVAEVDPWTNVQERYAVGDRVRGIVTNLADYGAFVEIEPGVEGLCHHSEMSPDTMEEGVRTAFSKGDSVEVVVLSIDPSRRRIALGQLCASELLGPT